MTMKADEEDKKEAAKLAELEKKVKSLEDQIREDPGDKATLKALGKERKAFAAAKKKLEQAKKRNRGNNASIDVTALGWQRRQGLRPGQPPFGNGSMKPDRNLELPEGQRLGILTHPSWLVSHSTPWTTTPSSAAGGSENLLGGGIPDVPITVDAMLPDEPQNTLRERMRVTAEVPLEACKNGSPRPPLRNVQPRRPLPHRRAGQTRRYLRGDHQLRRPRPRRLIENAIEMIAKLAESERVEQVFVRHAFRFWMGRNETLNDAPVLRPTKLQAQRWQHECTDHLPRHLRRVPQP